MRRENVTILISSSVLLTVLFSAFNFRAWMERQDATDQRQNEQIADLYSMRDRLDELVSSVGKIEGSLGMIREIAMEGHGK